MDQAVWRDAIEAVVYTITSYAYEESLCAAWQGLDDAEKENLRSYWVGLILGRMKETQE